MVKRVPSTDKVRIDPLFPIPEGAEDQFTFTRENTDTQAYLLEDQSEETFFEEGAAEVEELMAPTDLEVLKQTVTVVKGGADIVDVVFRFTPVEGAVNYELQVVKL